MNGGIAKWFTAILLVGSLAAAVGVLGGPPSGATPGTGEPPGAGMSKDEPGSVVSEASGAGYWMADSSGRVYAFGTADHHGDLAGAVLGAEVMALEPHPGGGGYWLLVEDGRVFAFGSANTFALSAEESFSAAHAGGLDSRGCHGGSRPYHCHGGSPAPTTAPTTTTTTTTSPPAPTTTCADIGHRVYSWQAEYHRDLDADQDGVGCEAWPEPSIAGFVPPERWTAMSAHPSGNGYWVFSNRGRVAAYGVAADWGDLDQITLAGPIIAAVATLTGNGYYLLGSDGGVFAFGDAAFHGSMGGTGLNQPAVGLVPDPDGIGYWFVAADGGVFAFEAPFVGSIPGVLPPGGSLNQPINGMVPYGNGYLMVAFDGGVFNFATDLAFAGSLGGNPLLHPVIAVASPSSG